MDNGADDTAYGLTCYILFYVMVVIINWTVEDEVDLSIYQVGFLR